MAGGGPFAAPHVPGGHGPTGRRPDLRGSNAQRPGRESSFFRSENNSYQGRRSMEQDNFRGGKTFSSIWRPRGRGRNNFQSFPRDSSFDLRENLKHNRKSDESANLMHEDENLSEENIQADPAKMDTKDKSKIEQEIMDESEFIDKKDSAKPPPKNSSNALCCNRCGKFGHKSEDCLKPVM